MPLPCPELPDPERRWTPDRIELVVRLWGAIPARQIAKLLGSDFTKDMVISIAHRSGCDPLPSPLHPTSPTRGVGGAGQEKDGRYRAPLPPIGRPDPPIVTPPQPLELGPHAFADVSDAQLARESNTPQFRRRAYHRAPDQYSLTGSSAAWASALGE